MPTTARRTAIIVVCAALNAGIGFLVQSLKLPIYLDLCGSVIAAAILGIWPAVIAAALGIAILGFITVPTAFAYVGTAVAVTAAAWWLMRFGYLTRLVPTLWGGLLLGLLSATLSAPITTVLFGGVSLVGADAATAFFRATGENLMTSVLFGGLATDPVDKILMSLICFSLYRSLPPALKQRSLAE